jgi:uncharacterized protein with FMN-binding domain
MNKTVFINILILALLISCSGIRDFFNPEPDLIVPGTIDLSLLPDSTYLGRATCGPVKVEVDVWVEDHRIQSIRILKHRTGEGESAELIIDDVIREQSVQVDVISGATISSKTILLAIETALSLQDDPKSHN